MLQIDIANDIKSNMRGLYNMSNGMDAVNDIRVNWAINDAKRDEGLTAPGTVERFDDIVYGEDKKWQSLDVY